MKTICEKCEDKTSQKRRNFCKKRNNCKHWNTLEGFRNYGNYNKDLADEGKFLNNKTLFTQVKIILIMLLITIYSSHQHYNIKDFSLEKISKLDFNILKPEINNLIYLIYTLLLFGVLYTELTNLYDK